MRGSGGARRLGLAGFCAIAVAFGPARAGYGLFLPDFRDEFGLSIWLAGFVASGLQAGYLVALTLVGLLVARLGPRPFVIVGMLAASLGMALVALAPGAVWLAAGVVLAGTSAGWSWAPYNDAVDRAVPENLRGRVLSVISTGTTFGVLAAGLTALAMGTSWRAGWFVFATAALVAVAINAAALPAGAAGAAGAAETGGPAPARPWRPGFLRRAGVAPLFVVAFSFGAVSAFYWAFAVDLVSGATRALPLAVGPLFYFVVGVVGFAGLFVGDAMGRFGLVPVLLSVLAALCVSSLLLAGAPGSLAASGVSAALYGAGVMAMSSLLAVWSSTVFAEAPSTGFSATLFLFGLGCVVGPAALGATAGRLGLEAAFGISAGVVGLTAAAALLPVGEKAREAAPNVEDRRGPGADGG